MFFQNLVFFFFFLGYVGLEPPHPAELTIFQNNWTGVVDALNLRSGSEMACMGVNGGW